MCRLMLPRKWLLFTFLFYSAWSNSQQYIAQYRFLSEGEGLPSLFVNAILQDGQGDMWLSTAEGLCRYDGVNFTLISREKAGLPTDNNNLLLSGPDNVIWVGQYSVDWRKHYAGFNKLELRLYDPKTGQALGFEEYFGEKAPCRQEDIVYLSAGQGQEILLGTRQGRLYGYGPQGWEFLMDNGGRYPLGQALRGPAGSFWAVGPGILERLTARGQVLDRDSVWNTSIRMRPLKEGAVYLFGRISSTQKEHRLMVKYPGEPLSFSYRFPEHVRLDVSQAMEIVEDARGMLWSVGKDGLKVWDASGRLAFQAGAPIFKVPELSYFYYSSCFFFDNGGIAWICSSEDMLLLDLSESYFGRLLHDAGLSTRSIMPLAGDTVLVNTYKGLMYADLSTGASGPFAAPYQFGIGYCPAGEGRFWVSTHSGVVFLYTPGSASHKAYQLENPYSNLDALPLQPYTDRRGNTWVGTASGLARFDSLRQAFVFDSLLNKEQGLANLSINAFHENAEGLWLLTNEGLFLMDGRFGLEKKAPGLPFTNLMHLHEDGQGRFWLSTRGGGLIRWDRRRDRYRQWTLAQGLSSNIVYAAYPDSLGHLWLPGKKGLMRLDTSSGYAVSFFAAHGLPADEFNAYSHLSLPDGRFIFGGLNGLALFHPSDVGGDEGADIPLKLLEILRYDNPSGKMESATEDYAAKGILELRRRHRFFTARFVLQDHFSPNSNRYAYRIEGLDESWQNLQENQLRIGALPYGKYLLRIRAMGHKGLWSKNELLITIHSIRPFYLAWWAIALMAIMVAGMGAALMRFRYWQLKRSKLLLEAEVARRIRQIERDRRTIAEQKAHLEELNAAKDKLFSIVGHELRGPLMYFGNIANRISYALQRKEYENLAGLGSKVKNMAHSTNNMLNNLLNWSLLESGRLTFGKGPADLLPAIGEVLETYREVAALKQLRLEQEIEPGLRIQAGREGLAILLQNLLSNAIKFTPEGGEVWARARREGNRALIEVRDSGMGMPPEQAQSLLSPSTPATSRGTAGERGAGLGLQIVQEILKRCDGELKVESQTGKGSTFTIFLPLAEEA